MLAVGAPGIRGNVCPDNGQADKKADQHKHPGAVYIFERSAGGLWTQRACLKGAGAQAMRWFGRITTLSANGQVLVTTSENTDTFSIFERTGQFWTPRGILVPPADKPRHLENWIEGSNQSVALNDDGSVIAIGMQAQNTVYVHQRKDREWSLKATLPAPSSEIGRLTSLGLSVSINGAGTRLAASAYEQVQLYRRADRGSKDCPDDCLEEEDAHEGSPTYGVIALYEVGDGGKWNPASYLRLRPLIPGKGMDNESALVRMSRDGNTVVAGGFGGNYIGAEYFAVSSDGIPTITDEMRKSYSYFTGYAKENIVWKNMFGSSWLRKFSTAWLTERKDGVWQEPTRFRPPAAIERDRFGQSVAIDANGQTIAVGAPMRGAPLTDDRPAPLKFGEGIFHSGAVYIYTRPDPAE